MQVSCHTWAKEVPSKHLKQENTTYVPQWLCWVSVENHTRRRSLDWTVKAKRKQGDHTLVHPSSSWSSLQACFCSSSGDAPTVLSRENAELFAPLLVQSCWLARQQSQPRKGHWEPVCTAEFQKSQAGQESSGIWHVSLLRSFMDGSWINSNASSTPAPGTCSLHKEQMSWPPVPPQSHCTVTALLMHHKAKASTDKTCGC